MPTRNRGKWKCGGCDKKKTRTDKQHKSRCGKVLCEDCVPGHGLCDRGVCLAGVHPSIQATHHHGHGD